MGRPLLIRPRNNTSRKEKIDITNSLQLREIIEEHIQMYGNGCDLNHLILTDKLNNLENLFKGLTFFGDISEWDTSRILSIRGMFRNSKISVDISGWDMSNVLVMERAFASCYVYKLGDIGKWNVGQVRDFTCMFEKSNLTERHMNLSNWDVRSADTFTRMFRFTHFNGDITRWNTTNVRAMSRFLETNPVFNRDISKWDVKNVKWGLMGVGLEVDPKLMPKFSKESLKKEWNTYGDTDKYYAWRSENDHEEVQFDSPIMERREKQRLIRARSEKIAFDKLQRHLAIDLPIE